MAGHSKWANIRHRKGRVDAARAKTWSKISRAIIAAARAGGGDPATNLSLRYAIEEAKSENMPKDTINRAVDKGAGAGQGEDYENVTYEGYGPGGVAVLVEALTDNRTRTAGDVRYIFGKNGGNIGTPGSVAFMFQTKGRIFIESGKVDEDQLMELALEAGAEDVELPEDEGDAFTVVTEATEFIAVKTALEEAGIEMADSGITKIPDNEAELSSDDATKLLKLVDALDDNDDVQKVHHNGIIPDDVLASLE
ncbi:MAG: YebC/PmpR family DNA-binding transcriptional regulator [Planctomycetota bacterium]